MGGLHQVAPDPKEIVDGCMDKEEALNLSRRFEAAQVAFALAGRLMGDLGPIVGVLVSAVPHGGERRLVEHKRHSLSCRSHVL